MSIIRTILASALNTKKYKHLSRVQRMKFIHYNHDAQKWRLASTKAQRTNNLSSTNIQFRTKNSSKVTSFMQHQVAWNSTIKLEQDGMEVISFRKRNYKLPHMAWEHSHKPNQKWEKNLAVQETAKFHIHWTSTMIKSTRKCPKINNTNIT